MKQFIVALALIALSLGAFTPQAGAVTASCNGSNDYPYQASQSGAYVYGGGQVYCGASAYGRVFQACTRDLTAGYSSCRTIYGEPGQNFYSEPPVHTCSTLTYHAWDGWIYFQDTDGSSYSRSSTDRLLLRRPC